MVNYAPEIYPDRYQNPETGETFDELKAAIRARPHKILDLWRPNIEWVKAYGHEGYIPQKATQQSPTSTNQKNLTPHR